MVFDLLLRTMATRVAQAVTALTANLCKKKTILIFKANIHNNKCFFLIKMIVMVDCYNQTYFPNFDHK